jgi:hypothetical protein
VLISYAHIVFSLPFFLKKNFIHPGIHFAHRKALVAYDASAISTNEQFFLFIVFDIN